MKWYLSVLKKYAVFSGRASRKEYWFFVLFNIIIGIAISILDNLLGTKYVSEGAYMVYSYGYLSLIYSLAVIIPGLAVLVRRLHDTGRSGGWVFISLVPLIGFIWLLVLTCLAGNPETNKYGEVPAQ